MYYVAAVNIIALLYYETCMMSSFF